MKLDQFCADFKRELMASKSTDQLIASGKLLLASLVADPGFLQQLFESIALDDGFSASRLPNLEDNEILLYRDEQRLFSIRVYVWEPKQQYPIHDHGSWGIVGCAAGEIIEYQYERLDDGNKPDYGQVREKARVAVKPGQVTSVKPLDEGIHRIEAVGARPAVTVHLYGQAVRKGYINTFNEATGFVKRLYPPRLCERMSVLKALAALNNQWSEAILNKVADSSVSYQAEEARRWLGLKA